MFLTPRTKHLLLLTLLALVFYLPGLGGVHLFDWDEINFAEISREMLLLGEYLRVYIDFQPFWEKPPLFFWLQAGAMHLFGVGEFAARLPNAINGWLTLIMVYLIGSRLYHVRFGMFWALTYFGSILPFLYAKSGIIDPWFNLFIFLGIYGFIRYYWQIRGILVARRQVPALAYLIGGGLILGLAMLTKGPVALLIAGLTLGVYGLSKRLRQFVSPGAALLYGLASLAVMALWLGLETLQNGTWFIREFTLYQYRLFSTPDAGHRGFPGYHVFVLLLGVFPASIFMVRSFFRMEPEAKPHQQDFRRWMNILFWVVLILFSLVKSKIVHYSSMAYLPMTYLAAVVIQHWWEGRLSFNRWMQAGLLTIGGLFAVATLALPWLGMHIEVLEPLFAADPFARANLEAEVEWTGWEALAGLWLLLVLAFTIQSFRRANIQWGVPVLFVGTAAFVLLTLALFINHIEHYSQRAAISFFQDRVGETCYVRPLGYKSYAHLYYTDKQPGASPASADQEWLLSGPIDRPAYFITKINKTERLEAYPDIREIGRSNGFVFYRRDPPQ